MNYEEPSEQPRPKRTCSPWTVLVIIFFIGCGLGCLVYFFGQQNGGFRYYACDPDWFGVKKNCYKEAYYELTLPECEIYCLERRARVLDTIEDQNLLYLLTDYLEAWYPSSTDKSRVLDSVQLSDELNAIRRGRKRQYVRVFSETTSNRLACICVRNAFRIPE